MYIPFNENIVKEKGKRTILLVLIIVFPILFGIGMLWLRSTNYPVYEIVGMEDHIIEWSQFFLFGASGIISLILAFRFRKISKLMFVIFSIVGLGLIFVTGEEISWGERIFNIQAPAVFDGETKIVFLEHNVQSEMNLHNFETFHSRVGYIYLAIGVYGCFAWIVACILDKVFKFKKEIKRYLPFFFPPPYLFFYFLVLGKNLHPRAEEVFAPQDYEMVEFVFSLGVFIFILLCFEYFKKKFENKKTN